jgi:hypothetical protein
MRQDNDISGDSQINTSSNEVSSQGNIVSLANSIVGYRIQQHLFHDQIKVPSVLGIIVHIVFPILPYRASDAPVRLGCRPLVARLLAMEGFVSSSGLGATSRSARGREIGERQRKMERREVTEPLRDKYP